MDLKVCLNKKKEIKVKITNIINKMGGGARIFFKYIFEFF